MGSSVSNSIELKDYAEPCPHIIPRVNQRRIFERDWVDDLIDDLLSSESSSEDDSGEDWLS